MEVIKIIYNSFKGVFVWLSSMIGISLLNISEYWLSGAVLVSAPFAIFKLINEYRNWRDYQRPNSKPERVLSTREQEKAKREYLEANKPKSRSNTYNR